MINIKLIHSPCISHRQGLACYGISSQVHGMHLFGLLLRITVPFSSRTDARASRYHSSRERLDASRQWVRYKPTEILLNVFYPETDRNFVFVACMFASRLPKHNVFFGEKFYYFNNFLRVRYLLTRYMLFIKSTGYSAGKIDINFFSRSSSYRCPYVSPTSPGPYDSEVARQPSC